MEKLLSYRISSKIPMLGKLFILLFLFSCSTSQTQKSSAVQSQEVLIRAKRVSELALGNHQFIDFHLENKMTSWKQIKRIRLLKVSGSTKFSALKESRFYKWKEDLKKKKLSQKTLKRIDQLSFDNGLLKGMPLSLPGKFKVERWLIIYFPQETIKSIELELTFMDAKKKAFQVDLH